MLDLVPNIEKVERVETFTNESGKRVIAATFITQNNIQIYCAIRSLKNLRIRGSGKSISQALRDDKAAWMFSKIELYRCKSKKIQLMCVFVKETKDFYFIRTKDVFSPMIGFDDVSESKYKTPERRCAYVKYFWKISAQVLSVSK